MNIRRSALGGAAIAALTLCGAAFAQDPAPGTAPTQNSTPAEKVQTDQLNATQQQNANSNTATNDAAQQQYQQQQQVYQSQHTHYANEKARYDANYAEWRHRYESTHWGDRSPYRVGYNDPSLVHLSSLTDPAHQLAFALVVGPEGNWVGKINNVDANWDGHPDRVQIAISDTRGVWVNPNLLRYDLDQHVVVTNLTRAELWAMPNALIQSSSAY